MATDDDRIARLLRTDASESRLGGGAGADRQQHARGKLTARERLDLLLDEGSFVELDAFVTHRSTDFGLDEERYPRRRRRHGPRPIDGRLVFVFSQDFTVFGGSLSEALRREDLQGDGPRDEDRRAGHRPQRFGRRAHPGGRRLARRLRRHLPAQHARVGRRAADLASILGPCAGGAVYSPAITDFTFMVRGHELHVRHRARTS